jgi:hypothetical protein
LLCRFILSCNGNICHISCIFLYVIHCWRIAYHFRGTADGAYTVPV